MGSETMDGDAGADERMDARAGGTTRRRLGDRIEDAFALACWQGEADIAACLLKALDLSLLARPLSWERRQRALGVLRACHAQLEQLRQGQPTAEPALRANEANCGVVEPNSANPACWATLPTDTNCHTEP
jgi:hypothetical protein